MYDVIEFNHLLDPNAWEEAKKACANDSALINERIDSPVLYVKYVL